MNSLIFIVVGMALVTYLPRMLPLVLLRDIKLPKFINTFLQFIPFAILGALIFPGILSSTGEFTSSAVGTAAAVVLALLRLNIVLVVLGSILAAFLWGTVI